MNQNVAEAPRAYGGLPLALGLTTTVQGLATLIVLALATLAPIAAPSLGVGPEAVGYQISVIYTSGALVSAFAGTLVHRFGGCAISQAAMVLGAVGCLGMASGSLPMVALASVLIGISYGMTNPAASQVLNRVTPAGRQGIVFSLKQTGVPLGGVVAGLSLPVLALLVGWQMAVCVVGGCALLLALCMIPLRSRWDFDRDRSVRIAASLVSGPVLVWSVPRLRVLALMGFCFSAVQLSLMSFLVTLLVEDARWSLVAAGGAASLVQSFGAGARIGWGLLADKIGNGIPVLIAIGVITVASSLVVSQLVPDWPDWLVLSVLSVFGVAAIGWNGVFIAEVVRSAPAGKAGIATGGTLTLTFAGVVLGPSLYAMIHGFFDSYAATFLALAVFPVIGVFLMLTQLRPQKLKI
ncbi:MAG: MFS transporter [Gammaproteobacteria bacterium]|nr:MFS transporter [Gammaproteobacteria bacterium]